MCSASSTKTSSTPARMRCSAALRPERPPPMIRTWTSGCRGANSLHRRASSRCASQPFEGDARVVLAAAKELGAAQLARGSVYCDFVDAAFLPSFRGHQQVGRLRVSRAVRKNDRTGTIEREFPRGFGRIANLLAVRIERAQLHGLGRAAEDRDRGMQAALAL